MMDFTDLINILRDARSRTPVNFTVAPDSPQLNTPAPTQLMTPATSMQNLHSPVEEINHCTPTQDSPKPPQLTPQVTLTPMFNIQLSVPVDHPQTRTIIQRLVAMTDASTQYVESDFLPTSTSS
ncbi:hypothetical protein WDU94_010746 [Cyamophila willieti]